MYSVDENNIQILIKYSEVFSGDVPELKDEIFKLNMHKAISIVCELIAIRDATISVKCRGEEYKLPFETVLKREICGIDPKSTKKRNTEYLLGEDKHIVSLQMLLLLLKNIIHYGNYQTLDEVEYKITQEDYKQIIKLQLIVLENVDNRCLEKFDENHFIYSSYHLYSRRSVACEFLRMYYILEKISRDKDAFGDAKNEYRDYYTDFENKYGFTPIEYSALLFGELDEYCLNRNSLSYASSWRNIEKRYCKIGDKDLITKIINTLGQSIHEYSDWVAKSIDKEWDFSKFFEFPFFIDQNNNYISICDITLKNAFFEKIFWLIRDCYDKEDSRSMSFFGRLFEKYVQDLTQSAAKDDYKYIAEFSYRKSRSEKKSSDAYILNNSNLLVVEAKGFSVFCDCMAKNEKIERNNKKLFIDPILQADSRLNEITKEGIQFENIEDAYIISVTMDNISAVPGYYDQIHEVINNKKICKKTRFYFNFSIEEYEMLMYLLEQGEDIFNLLRNYYTEKKLQPFCNYIEGRFDKINRTTFMEKWYNEAINNLKKIWGVSK